MKRMLLLTAGLIGAAIGARADVGDPIFPCDMNDKSRAEFVYDHMNRKTDLTIGDQPSTEQKINADIFMLRIHTDVGKKAYLDFDVGGIEPTGSDFGFYGGIGVRLLAYDSEMWRLSAEAQGHYAPSLSGKVGGVDSDYHIWNADAALLLSAKLPVEDQFRCLPYVGPVLSIMRLDGKTNTGSDENVSADEKSVIGGVAGVCLQLPGANDIRLEGRYFGSSAEVSVAVGIAF